MVQRGELPAADEAPDLHAGFWRRVAACILDIIIVDIGLLVIWVLVFGSVGAFGRPSQPASADLAIAWIVLEVFSVVGGWLYWALFESSRLQATPGKMALGIVVTDFRGRRIGFGRATTRLFAKILSGMIFYIGYLMAAWTERKQALHDLIAGTCVARQVGLEGFASPDASTVGAEGEK